MKRIIQWSHLLLALRTGITLYVCLAILYTSNAVFSPLVRSMLGRLPAHYNYSSLRDRSAFLLNDILGALSFDWKQGTGSTPADNPVDTELAFFTKHSDDVIYWDSSMSTRSGASYRKFRRTQKGDTSMKASLFLSKAFATSQEHLAYADQNNLDIIPYYYRASAKHDSNDVTITTLVTHNRFAVFKQLVERGRKTEDSENFLDALHALRRTSRVDSRPGDRQFNAWRNIARLFARTDYVMMLDVDFVPCTDFRKRLRRLREGKVKELLRSGDAALVVPAFEYLKNEEGSDARNFPKNKDVCLKPFVYTIHSRIAMFHSSWTPGHNSTDYPRFLFQARPGEVYKVESEHYQYAYEPYVIFRREGPGAGVPWCDERFVGYGGNKAACLYEMYLSGVSFYVLADDFLVHQSHAYDEQARKLERRYNRKIYADFREEVCLRYLTAFRDAGTIEGARAHNAREECKKIKGVARVAAMVCLDLLF
ncbi:glycosyl-transferase for dystroglycan-domain-containing protein [Phellopilus nigrolimitatus]|nr:glycosyl-transferase for dystroglycan-domain-containing protein [Phellopilus nigrolimitatus]